MNYKGKLQEYLATRWRPRDTDDPHVVEVVDVLFSLEGKVAVEVKRVEGSQKETIIYTTRQLKRRYAKIN